MFVARVEVLVKGFSKEGISDVDEALIRCPLERQVRSQLPEVRPRVTLCVSVASGLVVGTSHGRRIVTSSFLALRPDPVESILRRNLRAVALDVSGSLTVIAVVAAPRSGHRRSTPGRGRRKRLPEKSSMWKLMAACLI